MDKKFYTDDFEQFLKETTDDFRMYPSRRVWNSLYNNLHPGRRWPSLAVSLILISSIIFIGLSHKNELTGSTTLVNNVSGTKDVGALLQRTQPGLKYTLPVQANPTHVMVSALLPGSPGFKDVALNHDNQPGASLNKRNPISNKFSSGKDENQQTGILPVQSTAQANNHRDQFLSNNAGISVISGNADEDNSIPNEHEFSPRLTNNITLENDGKRDDILTAVIIQNKLAEVKLPALKGTDNQKSVDREWIENYAFHNQASPSLKSKLLYEFYFTPSLGYRTLRQTTVYTVSAARPSSLTGLVPDGHPALQQSPALNLELGYTVIYTHSKAIQIKAGVQLNYTNYKTNAHLLGHSTSANLVLHDAYSSNGIIFSSRGTDLANLYGNANDKKIDNNTVQVSLPIGANVKIAGRQHNLQWYAGATLQPTYILFGNAYLVSADFKNYIYDAKFLNKWNINAGVEAFVSYRTKQGITFTAGPQFRYQLFSTYRKEYTFDEKLYNTGIKFGVVKNF